MDNDSPAVLSQDIGDVELQYLHYEGDGPVIIFMHAVGFLPWMWHPIARQLGKKYRVIAPYFCDHREVDPHAGGLSWSLLAEDLCALCKRLGLKNPFMVGHSMGATVMAIANAEHGAEAEKMMLIEPIFLPQGLYNVKLDVENHPLASKSIKRLNQWQNQREAREYLKSRKLFRNWDDEMLDIYIKYGFKEGETGGLVLACHPAREASLFLGGMSTDPWPLLSGINCPVLVVEGGESENRPYVNLKKAASLMPNGSYTLLEAAGHLIPMEKPLEILNMINEFFAP